MKLLSNGSVVTLNDSDKKMMIIGVLQKHAESGKLYDYIGCYHPEGYLDSNTVFLFNNENIKEVSYLGFVDAEFQGFRAMLAKRFAEIESKKTE
jgi:hypothetical protein